MAGSVGTIVATLLLFPLERVKTLMQTSAFGQNAGLVLLRVLRDDGQRGLYRGCLPMVQTVGISQFLYFYLFQGFKEKFAEVVGRRPGKIGPYETLLASAMAGALNMVITEPLWRSCVVAQARTRSFDHISVVGGDRHLASSSYPSELVGRRPSSIVQWVASQAADGPGVFSVVYRTWTVEGPGALWRGLGSSLWLVSNPVIQFFAYDLLKALYLGDEAVSSVQAFVIGAIAKALATVATFPLQVAQSKLRAHKDQGGQGRPELSGMVPCLKYIVRQAGMQGLFTGLWAKLLQTVTQTALMFAIYEKIHYAIRRANRQALRNATRIVPVRPAAQA